MNKLIALALIAGVAGCAATTVDVKGRWTKNLAAYSFVPIYPPRDDVAVGDIRVHRTRGGSQVFDSRLLWKSDVLVPVQPRAATALLPGIEVVRLSALDVSTLGLAGVFTKILGTRVEASDSLHIALTDLKTKEVSDLKVAHRFREHVRKKLDLTQGANSTDLTGFCAAAVTLGDAGLKDISVSFVTRTLSVGGMEYFSGSAVSTVRGGASLSQNPLQVSPISADSGVTQSAVQKLSTGQGVLNPPVVIGVDALTVVPVNFIRDLSKRCAFLNDGFEPARLGEFRSRAKGR